MLLYMTTEIPTIARVDGIASTAASAVICINNIRIGAAMRRRHPGEAASARLPPLNMWFKGIPSLPVVPTAADTGARLV